MTLSRRQFLAVTSAAPLAASLATGFATVAAAATTHEISISGFAFAPASLTISAGDSVNFTNSDGAPHTATAQSAGLDTGRLGRGESGTLRFDTPGTYDYVCRFHPNMRGTITVT